MKILGIETTCDETAVAIVENGEKLLSNVVASSMNLHKKYGGVVPEIAARSHIEYINPVIDEALKTAKCNWSDVDCIAVSYGPGLSGSLLVGVLTARTLAITKNIRLIPVNHVQAHVSASFITKTSSALSRNYKLPITKPEFPVLALIVSGGHTQLVLFNDFFDYELLGKTHDDAVGEAFDKVAKILGLAYPGGPSVEKSAKQGDPKKFQLPLPHTQDKYGFSYSGLKTAVLRTAQKACDKPHDFPSYQLAALLSDQQKADLSASFQQSAFEQLVKRTVLAIKEFQPKNIIVAGGVASSNTLRKMLEQAVSTPVIAPDPKLCTDNGAMIAVQGYYLYKKGAVVTDPFELDINSSLSM